MPSNMPARINLRYSLVSFAIFSCMFFYALSANAQGGSGFRAGASVDPDQFYFGGHLELGPVVEQLWFRPNIEVGLGNDRTLVALNGELAYFFRFPRNEWSLYVGAGPGVNIIRFDQDRFPRRGTDIEGGFNILLGMSHSQGFFGELKVGALQSPEVKIGVGYTFR